MAKILITGGSGLVGRAISELLLKKGHEISWLSREKGNWRSIQKFRWDLKSGYIDEAAFTGVEALIHLAGTGIIDKLWTNAFKKEIIASRVKSSQLLFDTISKNNFEIKTLVGSSAVGYYGSVQSEHCYSENDAPGSDFLAQTCIAWEKSYAPFINSGIRTVIIRTGVVLSKEGGAYEKMLPAFRLGLGAPLASGKQYFPWIHIKDLAGIFIHALLHENMSGPYNAAASRPVNNREFSRELAKSLNRPLLLPPVPAFVLKLALGERAVTITSGLKINNKKIKAAGFEFEFDDLENALKNLRI